MKRHQNQKTVLFLCTGNYYRSRFAEVLFNSTARKMGLSWRATSKGLALERGVNNVGPMAASAIKALEALGVRNADAVARFPAQVTNDDLEKSHRIVALKRDEHLPLLQERHPAWSEKVEFWEVDDTPEALKETNEKSWASLLVSSAGANEKKNLPNQFVNQRPSLRRSPSR